MAVSMQSFDFDTDTPELSVHRVELYEMYVGNLCVDYCGMITIYFY